MSQLHDDVQKVLKDVQAELSDLEHVAGHELIKLRDELVATLNRIRSAKAGHDYQAPEIEVGEGVASGAGELHPETVVSEPRPETAEELHQRADREPDPVVSEKVRATAKGRE